MPQIGPLEIAVILLVALIVFGPSKLPEVGKQAARGLREFKQFQSSMRSDLKGMLDSDETDETDQRDDHPDGTDDDDDDGPGTVPKAEAGTHELEPGSAHDEPDPDKPPRSPGEVPPASQ